MTCGALSGPLGYHDATKLPRYAIMVEPWAAARAELGPRQVVPRTATALIVLASQVNRHLVSLPQKSSLTLGVRVTESVPDSNTSLLERRILEGIGVTCVDACHRTWE